MVNKYKIILLEDIIGNLSVEGEFLLQNVRYSNDGKYIIRCVDHPVERIQSIFKPEFDYISLLNNNPTLTRDEVLLKMKDPNWALTESDDS